MKIFVGNCSSIINCDQLIAECIQHTVQPYHSNMDLDPVDLFYEDHLEQKQMAKAAGYTSGNSIEFRHYYPKQHFNESYISQFESFVNATCLLSFISEIRPGKCAPWHWDINPWLNDYPEGEIVRYVCFIDKPKYGQAFMIEEDCFYMEPQGNVFQYPSLNSWHAGFNAGLDTKFLFTFTGLKKT